MGRTLERGPFDGREAGGLCFRLRVGHRGRPGSWSVMSFPHPVALVGRHPLAHVSLVDPSVSRRHVLIHLISGRLFWADLGSRTGVRVGGRAARSGWLGPGEVVEVGPFWVGPDGGPEPSAPPANPLRRWAPGLEPSPAAVFEIPGRDGGPTGWAMDRGLALVGSAPPSKVRLQDPSVSRVHCSLLRTPRSLWVTDLLGRETVLLNGEPVRFARVREGDVLTVGVFRMRLRYETAPGGAGQAAVPARPRALTLPGPVRAATPPAAAGAGEGALMDRLLGTLLGESDPEQVGGIRAELVRIRESLERARAAGPGPTRPRPRPGAPRPGKGPDPVEGPPPAGGEPPAETVHALLCQRLAEMSTAHRSPWQKLITRIGGH